MHFSKELIPGRLIKRYKRFLADVRLYNGTIVTAHCTNSGSMKTCIEEGAPVYLSPVDNPARKTKYTWEMIKINQQWIGINTNHPNLLVYEAIYANQVPGLHTYDKVKREVKYGDSRFDIMAQNSKETIFIEVKNVTMKHHNYALFPDAKTTRGRKHLETLIKVKQSGIRAAMFYVIQRQDIEKFGPASNIDPQYAATLIKAVEAGVEVFVMMAKVTPQSILLQKPIPFDLYPNV